MLSFATTRTFGSYEINISTIPTLSSELWVTAATCSTLYVQDGGVKDFFLDHWCLFCFNIIFAVVQRRRYLWLLPLCKSFREYWTSFCKKSLKQNIRKIYIIVYRVILVDLKMHFAGHHQSN